MNEELRYRTECITYEIKRVLNFRKKRYYFMRWRNRIFFCILISGTIFGFFLAVSFYLCNYRIVLIGYLVAKYFYEITKIIVFHQEKDKLILIAFTSFYYRKCKKAIRLIEEAATVHEIEQALIIIHNIFQDTSLYYKKLKENVNAITNILEESNVNYANNQFVL